MLSRILAAILFVSVTSSPAAAEVVRIEVQSRADLIGGKPFGTAGPYEKLIGPDLLRGRPFQLTPNKIITDIDKAPRNARGRVEFSSDFFLIKPKQIERGNGTVLYEVSNRGGKGMLGFYNHATGSLESRVRRGNGRWLPDEAGLHAALGRLAVRCARARGPGPGLCAYRNRQRLADRGHRP